MFDPDGAGRCQENNNCKSSWFISGKEHVKRVVPIARVRIAQLNRRQPKAQRNSAGGQHDNNKETHEQSWPRVVIRLEIRGLTAAVRLRSQASKG